MSFNNSNPAEYADVIVPSDVNRIKTSRAIYVGVGGDVNVRMSCETPASVIFKNVPSGSILPIRAVLVYASGTTATDLVNLY
jgi:hypothetical protein